LELVVRIHLPPSFELIMSVCLGPWKTFTWAIRLAVFAGLVPACAIAAESPVKQPDGVLTYVDLVKRMTDFEYLALLPPPGETSAMASSYDRASQYDAAADQYLHWDANRDGSGFVRQEGDKVVLAEIEGPACIWRIWSANPSDKGHVRMYFDGSSTPSVDMTFRDYFGSPQMPWNELAYCHAGEPNKSKPRIEYNPGGNVYLPVPFQKSCKIVADKDWGQYFHFNYTRYPAGTVLPMFTTYLSQADRAAVDEVNARFGNPEQEPSVAAKGEKSQRRLGRRRPVLPRVPRTALE
jgi:hypothetical protein